LEIEKAISFVEQGEQFACPFCSHRFDGKLGAHVREVHGEDALRKAILLAKEQGMPDARIGARYGTSFHTLEQIVTEAYGANISVLKRPKRIRRWEPSDFREETTTVWSFRQRGNWATHDGRYRGNWSPYIPRNVILKYSRPGDTVLDYFVGGGTTAVEAKLLGRRCIARDINPGAVGITRENLEFSPPRQLFDETSLPLYDPEVSVGDARNLSDIQDRSVDLICAHPPYAGIIKYSANVTGDLSDLHVREFLIEMGKVARESLRVLKPGGKCAILIGDARKSKHVVPIGFQTIRTFLDAGFVLRDLVIKRQHNCRTTGFWYTRSLKYNFLLLAHEYLPIFEKPIADRVSEPGFLQGYTLPHLPIVEETQPIEEDEIETTTVWILPSGQLDSRIRQTLLKRFARPQSKIVEVEIGKQSLEQGINAVSEACLVYLKPPDDLVDARTIADYRSTVVSVAERYSRVLSPGDFLAIETRDVKVDGILQPMGLLLWEDLSSNQGFAVKEIIVVVPEEELSKAIKPNGVQIIHRYLLVYRKRSDGMLHL